MAFASPQLRIPTPGGGQAILGPSGVTDYRRPNWQQSEPVDANTAQTALSDASYTPYGEHYDANGYSGFFAGNLSIFPVFMDGYASTWRLYHFDQGRWISPDPAGLSAVDPSNPQTWNRYAYLANNPLNGMDTSGLLAYCPWGTIPGQNVCAGPPTSPCYSASSAAPPPGCAGSPPASSGYGPGGQGGGGSSSASAPSNGNQSASKIGRCLVKGAAVGAAGALILGGVAIGAATIGVPAAVVTGGLLLTGAVGGYFTGKSVINNFQSGNYAGVAYDVGSVAGGFLAGSGIGGRVGDAINPPATRGWSFSRDIQNRFDPSKGSVGNWLATGPDAGAAAGATGFSGSGIGKFLKSLKGGC